HFEEGSGLSRNNLTTPAATVKLLEYMSRHKWAEVYLDSLPIAGVDGTLRNRMKSTPAAGNVRAKTGTLRWANSLSGHVTTAAGERLVFSIMLNRFHSTDPGHSARADVDAVAVMLAGFAGKVGE
ncbi:MAG: D-alanyl-D-alanine carboxypeptidase/D-alanyl-D-alanine-endopeptidase, partial [Verrucomicrobia bacterium]